jgi:alkylated DNA repair dioxygenase AlkB
MTKNPAYQPLSTGVTALALGGSVLYVPGWLSLPRSHQLLLEVEQGSTFIRESIRIGAQVREQPRDTAWSGTRYTAASRYRIACEAPAPGPVQLEFLQTVSQMLDWTPNAVLINRYRDGRDSVSWHADNERSLGVDPTIVSLSLGATRRFMIRPTDSSASRERFDVQLAAGDLLVMLGTMQSHYSHQVPKMPVGTVVGPRLNLTARRYQT